MKKITILFIFLLLLPTVLAVPKHEGFVTDNANILGDWEANIEKLCQDIEKNTTAEIAILTIDSLEGMPLEEYSLEVAREWGIGKEETDNGLLLLIAYKDRKYRFETGYGLEGVLPDARTGRIGRQVLTPYFKQSKFGQGTYEAIKEVQGLIKQDPSIVAKYEKSEKSSGLTGIIALAYAAILIAILLATEKRKHKWKIRTGADIIILIGSIFLGTLFFVMAFAMSIMFWIIATQIAFIKKGSKGGMGGIWFGGGRSSGGFSGGFGGFGGGGFGGGGSSGGW